jgi:regulatory protein
VRAPSPNTPHPGADSAAERLQLALGAAYRYLNPRERTQAEMRAHLQRAGIDDRDVERAITALVEEGHLDDARYARLFVQDKRELDEWGSERIRRVLLGRGVDRELIEEALAEHDGVSGHDSAGELARALLLLRRRFPAPARDRRERDRALGFLLRKGYETELALEAIAAHASDATTE